MTHGRSPAESDIDADATALVLTLPETVATDVWDLLLALVPLAEHGDDALDLFLAVALQGLLYRYTRGDAELTLRLSCGIDLPCVVAGDRSLLESLRLAGAQLPVSTWASLARAGGLSIAWSEAGHGEVGGEPAAGVLRVVATFAADGGGLVAHFAVDGPASALTAAWRPAKLAVHLQALLRGLAEAPEVALGRLPLLDAAEAELIAGPLSGSGTPALAPGVGSLAELFEQQAARRPDHPAVVCGGVELSYAELDRRANQLANHLRYHGIRRGDMVGLYLPRSANVYVGILGILKAGAAYVPIDPEVPPARAAFILKDVAARAVVTNGALAERTPVEGLRTVVLDRDLDVIRFESETLQHVDAARLGDPAYVIYTSGSTGLPKGVLIEHRNALAFVRAEAATLRVGPDDRVYQGFSVAFDASVEEIWLAFHAGATLVAATAEVLRSGPGIATFLRAARVTVLSTVPTLLMMLDDPLPDVHLLILGGEECPAELVRRFSRQGRRLVNTYGPTEATVVATVKDMEPTQPKVTIGRPLPGVRAFVLDAALEPLPIGLAGELCLGGPGVARGYVRRDDLTSERFVQAPAALGGLRLYRTGDLVRFNDAGELEFLGRIDSQVKLRGFRIELGEIETSLAALPGVRNAAVLLREDEPGLKQLVAYVVPAAGATLDAAGLRAELGHRLPAYMVPAHVVHVAALPTMPSGKVDRKQLPRPGVVAPAGSVTRGRQPVTATERVVHGIWLRLFHPQPVAMDDDFFALGGHSLLATRLLTELRLDARYGGASVLDVYEQPSLDAFCRRLDARRAEADAKGAQRPAAAVAPPAAWRERALCLLLQAAGLYGLFALTALSWLAPIIGYGLYLDRPEAWGKALALVCAASAGLVPLRLAFGIVVKWLVIGRFKAGRYPLWSVYYWRFWLTRRALALAVPTHLRGTPFLVAYYRLLGARIGRDVHLGTAGLLVTDLVTIGDGASVDVDVQMLGYVLRGGWLQVGPVTIGAGASVGARSVVEPGTTIGAAAELEELTLIPEGTMVGAGERWAGAPGRNVGMASPPGPPAGATVRGRPLGALAYRLALTLAAALATVLPFIAALPGLYLSRAVLGAYGPGAMVAVMPLGVAVFVVSWCLLVAAAKWCLVGRVAPGTYAVGSGDYVRKWCVDELLSQSIGLVMPLHATLYVAAWLRALGMRVGRGAEVSTAVHYTPDLVELGDGAFLADMVSLGAPRTRGGFQTLGRVHIGRGAFVGNSASLPPGTVLGDETLIGCQSRPPLVARRAAEHDSSWLGSPGIQLPRRQMAHRFAETYTFRPTRRLIALRLAIEFWRVTLPETLIVILSLVFLRFAANLYREWALGVFLAVLPLLVFALAWSAALATVALKWLLIGRYRPAVKPLWSDFVWRTEVVDALHEQLAGSMGLTLCLGTPLIPAYFRLLGARFGRRVVMETMDLTEYDLVEVGDDACLDVFAGLQTHLFEDRVMKMDRVTIGDRCSVGPSTIVLYDSELRPGSSLSGLSLLMKGEELAPDTRWHGSPLVPCND